MYELPGIYQKVKMLLQTKQLVNYNCMDIYIGFVCCKQSETKVVQGRGGPRRLGTPTMTFYLTATAYLRTQCTYIITLPAVHCAPFLGALDSVVFARWITQKLAGVSENGMLLFSFPGLLRFSSLHKR